jgi:hypothetical protein
MSSHSTGAALQNQRGQLLALSVGERRRRIEDPSDVVADLLRGELPAQVKNALGVALAAMVRGGELAAETVLFARGQVTLLGRARIALPLRSDALPGLRRHEGHGGSAESL